MDAIQIGGVGCGSVEAAGTAKEMLWPRMRELSARVVGDPAMNPLADPIILQKPAIFKNFILARAMRPDSPWLLWHDFDAIQFRDNMN